MPASFPLTQPFGNKGEDKIFSQRLFSKDRSKVNFQIGENFHCRNIVGSIGIRPAIAPIKAKRKDLYCPA